MGRGPPPAARRPGRGGAHGKRSPGRGVRRLAEVPRSARRAQPARARLRGSALGGRQPARLRRPPRRLGGRSADARRLHRSPRAPLAPSGLGRRQAERGDDLALAALRRRHGAPRPRAPRAVGSSGRRSVHADRARRAATRSTPRSSRAWSTSWARTGPASGFPSRCRESSPRASMRFRSTRSSCSRTRPSSARSSGSARWSGSAHRDRRDAELLLHRLERKEFVRRERRSSVGEESQYVFSHLLVGDVAYSQIPRAARSEKHQAAAAGGSSRSGRPEDHAEMLAHHYLTALELDRAAGVEPRRSWRLAHGSGLREAGDRATRSAPSRLRGGSTAPRSSSGLRTTRPDADLLFRYARVVNALEPTKSLGLMTEARDALLAAEDHGSDGRGRDPHRRDLLAPGPARPGVRTTARGRSADRRSAELVFDGVRGRERVAFLDARRGPRDRDPIGSRGARDGRRARHRRAAVARAQQHRHRPSRERRRGWARRPGAEPSRSR